MRARGPRSVSGPAKGLVMLVALLLILFLGTGIAQESWWNPDYQCRARINGSQPGDNVIKPFVDFRYLASLCNITNVTSWTIVQDGKQLPTYSYGPDEEKTIIYNSQHDRNQIAKNWTVTYYRGGKVQRGHVKSSRMYNITNENGTLEIVTEHFVTDFTEQYNDRTYVQYTATKNMYLPHPEKVKKITLRIEYREPHLTSSSTTIKINGYQIKSAYINGEETYKIITVTLPTKYLKEGNNRIEISLEHINYIGEYRGGRYFYQKTFITTNITTTDNQTGKAASGPVWLYYTDKKLPAGPEYKPLTQNSRVYSLKNLAGTYDPCVKGSWPEWERDVWTRTARLPIQKGLTVTTVHFQQRAKVVCSDNLITSVYSRTGKKRQIGSTGCTTLVAVPKTFHYKITEPTEYIIGGDHVLFQTDSKSGCYGGYGANDVDWVRAWYEYVPASPVEITGVEKYVPGPVVTTPFQPVQGTSAPSKGPWKGTVIPVTTATTAAAAAYAYTTLIKRRREMLAAKIREYRQRFMETVQGKMAAGQEVPDAYWARFAHAMAQMKRNLEYWIKYLAPVPQALYEKMSQKARNIFYRPDYVKYRLDNSQVYEKRLVSGISSTGDFEPLESPDSIIKEVQQTTFAPAKQYPAYGEEHWPSVIRSRNRTYKILTPIKPGTTMIIIQDTRTGQLYTLPIKTNTKNKSISYNLRNKKKYEPEHKITITMPDKSTSKHDKLRLMLAAPKTILTTLKTRTLPRIPLPWERLKGKTLTEQNKNYIITNVTPEGNWAKVTARSPEGLTITRYLTQGARLEEWNDATREVITQKTYQNARTKPEYVAIAYDEKGNQITTYGETEEEAAQAMTLLYAPNKFWILPTKGETGETIIRTKEGEYITEPPEKPAISIQALPSGEIRSNYELLVPPEEQAYYYYHPEALTRKYNLDTNMLNWEDYVQYHSSGDAAINSLKYLDLAGSVSAVSQMEQLKRKYGIAGQLLSGTQKGLTLGAEASLIGPAGLTANIAGSTAIITAEKTSQGKSIPQALEEQGTEFLNYITQNPAEFAAMITTPAAAARLTRNTPTITGTIESNRARMLKEIEPLKNTEDYGKLKKNIEGINSWGQVKGFKGQVEYTLKRFKEGKIVAVEGKVYDLAYRSADGKRIWSEYKNINWKKLPPERINKIKTQLMKMRKEAEKHGYDYELVSRTRIPKNIRNWLSEKGFRVIDQEKIMQTRGAFRAAIYTTLYSILSNNEKSRDYEGVTKK